MEPQSGDIEELTTPEIDTETESVMRFGISMAPSLVQQLDVWRIEHGYSNRSEAIRDMVRDVLVNKQWEHNDSQAEVVGVVTLVYNHTVRQLSENLIEAQHHNHALATASMHIHLTHDNCLEVIVLRGPRSEVSEMANQLISSKGVLHGKFIPTTTGIGII